MAAGGTLIVAFCKEMTPVGSVCFVTGDMPDRDNLLAFTASFRLP